jgi:hypothetical protein
MGVGNNAESGFNRPPHTFTTFCIKGLIMELLFKCDVPAYLHESALYNSFWDPDDSDADSLPIEVPSAYLKMDDSVHSDADARHLLSTIRYWLLDVMPKGLVAFVLDSRNDAAFPGLLADFGEDLKTFEALVKVAKAKTLKAKLCYAALSGDPRFLGDVHAHLVLDAATKKAAVSKCCICAAAAASGSLPCLQFLREEGFKWDGHASNAAIERDNLHVLRYLFDSGCPWRVDSAIVAAAHGSIECLMFMHERSFFLLSAEIADAAIKNNHVVCLRFLRAQGCPIYRSACTVAAEFGSLDCLIYAREECCPMTADTCAMAAKGGHFDCLRYVCDQGCPWDESTTRAAADNCQWQCLWYAVKYGCPFSYDVGARYAMGAALKAAEETRKAFKGSKGTETNQPTDLTSVKADKEGRKDEETRPPSLSCYQTIAFVAFIVVLSGVVP